MVIGGDAESLEPKNDNTYQYLYVAKSLPEPMVIRANAGCFYLYATKDNRYAHLQIEKSVDWEFISTAFTNETRPDFEPKGGL